MSKTNAAPEGAQAKAKSPNLRAVTALVPVNYDHVLVPPGEAFEVRAADLDQLLEVKAVELIG